MPEISEAEERQLMRYLATDGTFGGPVPEWYSAIQEARYVGLSPWDLVAQGTEWRDAIRAAMRVDTAIEKLRGSP